MKEYLSKDEVYDIVYGHFCASSDEVEETLNSIIAEVREAPAANVREQISGKWIGIPVTRPYAKCSVCGRACHPVDVVNGKAIAYPFCPYCTSKNSETEAEQEGEEYGQD